MPSKIALNEEDHTVNATLAAKRRCRARIFQNNAAAVRLVERVGDLSPILQNLIGREQVRQKGLDFGLAKPLGTPAQEFAQL